MSQTFSSQDPMRRSQIGFWRLQNKLFKFRNAPQNMCLKKLMKSPTNCLKCCLSELADTVTMSPGDRMRSLSLKLVSLGKIYAGTPRYFPLGGQFFLPAIIFSFPLVRSFQLDAHYFVNGDIIWLPFCTIYVSTSRWFWSVGTYSCWKWLLITASLFKRVLSAETLINFIYNPRTCVHSQIQLCPTKTCFLLLCMQFQ